MNEVETKDVGTTDLSAYMMRVIEELRRDRKPPAVHIYACTLRSFIRFSCSGEGGVLHADGGSLHTRSPERVRTVDAVP